MSDSAPAISVIVPVFNGAAFLAEAVASVRSQSLRPFEIIVVDDGSVDDTAAVIDSLGPELRSIRQPNRGPAAARNRGLEMARGDFIAFIDADDLWLGSKLEIQARRLCGDSAVQLVLAATQRVKPSDGSETGGRGQGLMPTGPVWMLLSLGAALFRRTVFDTVGQFDEDLRQGEDVDWFMRARELGIEMGVSSEVVQLYRRHGANLTDDRQDTDRFFLTVLRKSLDRRRADAASAKELAPIDELSHFKPSQGEDAS